VSCRILFVSGRQKLGISNPVAVCLQEDGTVIDDDDVLLEYKDEVIMMLASTETWTPVASSEPSTLVTANVPPVAVADDAGISVETGDDSVPPSSSSSSLPGL